MGKKVNHMVSWFLSVVILSLLPLGIKTLVYYLADKNIFFDNNVSFMGELFFFTLLLSADMLKTLTFDKIYEPSKALHHMILSLSLFLIIIASFLYGLVVINDVFPIIKLSFNPQKLKIAAISISGLSFVAGIAIQIFHIKCESKPNKENANEKVVT